MEDDLVVAGEMVVVALDGDRSCTSDESIHLIFNILDASRALSTPHKNRVSYSHSYGLIHKVYYIHTVHTYIHTYMSKCEWQMHAETS